MLLRMDSAVDGVRLDRTLNPDVDWVPDLTRTQVDRQRVYDITFTPMSEHRRNELVTLAYQDIALELARVLGSNQLPTWATFGQWPSNFVGTILRLPVPMIRQTFQRCFGHGNRGVFYDIGQAFATFISCMDGLGASPSPETLGAAWARCAHQLRGTSDAPTSPLHIERLTEDLPPTLDDLRPDGDGPTQYLFLGMWAYAKSMETLDPDLKAQRIYAANVLLAAHEQWWLQLALATGLRIPIRRVLYPTLNFRPRVQLRQTNNYVERHVGLDSAARWIEKWTIRGLTRWVIGFRLGQDWVRVGKAEQRQDVPALHELTDDTARGVVATFGIDRFDAAGCWLSYRERMAFVTMLFRKQIEPAVAFDEARRARIRANATSLVRPVPPRIPVGDLTPEQAAAQRALEQRLDQARRVVDPLASTFDLDPPRGGHAAIAADVATRWKQIRVLTTPQCTTDGTAFFKDHRLLVVLALLTSSIPDGYAASKGAKVLDEHSALKTAPTGRILRTLDFVLAVADTDAFDPTNDKLTHLIAIVREQHLWVRRTALRPPPADTGDPDDIVEVPWDRTKYGEPINAEDLFATMLSFVVPVIETFERLGIAVDPVAREAYLHRWCVIGYLMGCEYDLMTRTEAGQTRLINYDEALVVSNTIRRRHHRRSIHGVRLMNALMTDLGDHFPAGLGPLPEMLVRAVGDPRLADLLLVPDGVRGRVARRALTSAATLLRHDRHGARARRMLTAAGDRWLKSYRKRAAAVAAGDDDLTDFPPIMEILPRGCECEPDSAYDQIPPFVRAGPVATVSAARPPAG